MALPREPLTEEQAKLMLDAWRNTSYGAARASLWDQLVTLCNEPTFHVVHYRAGRTWYHRPENFPLLPRQRSPSDCTWIVPGTLERKI